MWPIWALRLLLGIFGAGAATTVSGLTEDVFFHQIDATGYMKSGKQYPATPMGPGTDCEAVANDGHSCMKQWHQQVPNVTCRGWRMNGALGLSAGVGDTRCYAHDDTDTPTHTWKGLMPLGPYFPTCVYADASRTYCMGDPAYPMGGHVQTITGLTRNQCQWYIDQQNALGHHGLGTIYPACN